MAYELFDGKYPMSDIVTMPYKELIGKIEREQEFQKNLAAQREEHEKSSARPKLNY